MENKYNIYIKENKLRRTNLTRKETSEYYSTLLALGAKRKDIIIYCPIKDEYITDTFIKEFLNMESVVGKIRFDDNAMLLSNTLRGLKWNHKGKICFTKNNQIEYIN